LFISLFRNKRFVFTVGNGMVYQDPGQKTGYPKNGR